jgi:hypothetical protein
VAVSVHEVPSAGVPLPASVEEVAARHDLGERVAIFMPHPARPFFVVLPALFGLLFSVMAIVFAINGTGSSPTANAVGVSVLGGLGLLLLGLLIRYLSRTPHFSAKVRAREVHVFQDGFIPVTEAGATNVFRFDAIRSISQRIVERYFNGAHYLTTHRYEIVRHDGGRVVLTHFHSEAADMGAMISTAVAKVQAPKVLEALNNGQSVGFGDLTLTPQGVATPRNGLLPWDDILRVEVVDGNVNLRKMNKGRPLSSTPTVRFLNLYTFLILVQAIIDNRD